MSQIKVNALVSYSGNTVTLGTSGDTINVASGVTFNTSSNIVLPAGAVGTPSLTTSGDTNTGIFFPAADTIAFTEGGTEVMRINSSGNVGIGIDPTFTPGGSRRLLQITNGSSGAQISLSNDANESENPRIFSGVDDLGFATATTGGGIMQFYTGGSERMRITSSGNVGIGTTDPDGTLTVTSTKTGTEASPHLRIAGDGYSLYNFLDGTAAYIGQNSGARSLRIYSGSNEAVGANLAAGGTSFGTYSDERLKRNINDLETCINKINSMRPITFNYISDEEDFKTRIGISAQSLVGQVDEALDLSKYSDEEPTEYYNVRYQDLIPVLVKGIQEQQAIIEQLEARLTALENNQ